MNLNHNINLILELLGEDSWTTEEIVEQTGLPKGNILAILHSRKEVAWDYDANSKKRWRVRKNHQSPGR